MSIDVQVDYNNRNRSMSDNPKQNAYTSRYPKNSFKIAGKLILDQNLSTRAPQSGGDNQQNSLQNMKNSVATSKTSKITDFVQLTKVKFDQTSDPPSRIIFSQQAIEANRTLVKANNNSIPSILVEEQQHSVMLESHQKLSESGKLPDEDVWNLEKLQMALDFVELQQAESPTLVRNPPKRRMRKEKERDLEKQKQRVRRQRERNMEMVSGFLSGKATFMWLFILGETVHDEDIAPVQDIYKTYLQNDYEVPICKDYNQAIRFLKIESCFFKIVSDIANSELLISQNQHNKNIIAIYIYNPQKEKGVAKAFEIKRSSRKVRGMFMEIGDAAQLAEQEIENEAKFIRVGQQLQRERNRLRFPGFFILNGVDNTDVTSYRMCLYGSLCLKQAKQRQLYLKQFTDMVELRYSNNQNQMRNLDDYKKIDHITPPDQQKHRQILSFYVRQSFYYALINAMLRLSRNAEQFRPCVIPFNQTYLAIKHFYKKYLNDHKQGTTKFTAYRGAKLRKSDVKSLQIGSLIELLGFTSTSLKKQQAQKFMDNDSYLIQIVVEKTASNQQQLDYDHGFIDINRYKLAASAFEQEQQVLFNALNVYQVTSLDLQSAVRKITLTYGAVVGLIQSKQSLKGTEISVLENYRHCVSSFKLIEDDGDALRLAQQHDQCVSYYQTKIQNGQGNAKSYGKLAGAQLEVGDIDAAYDNAIRSLSIIEQQAKKSPLSPSYRIPLELDSHVFEEKEDVVNYERSTDLCIQLLYSWEEKCKLLSERAEKKLQLGNYKGCISDLKLSQQILTLQEQSFDKRRSELRRKYFFSSLCCLCSKMQNDIEEAKQVELLRIEEDQILFESKKRVRREIKLRMEGVMKNVCLKIGDQAQYQQSLRRMQGQFKMLSSSSHPLSNLQMAKLQAMQAETLDLRKNFAEYEVLMEQAIENIRLENPLHPDIANYIQMLGNKRYEAIQQNLNISKDHVSNQPQNMPANFNYQEHKLMYKKCKVALLEAADQLAFQKGSTHRRTLAVQNQLATLDYDFSLLKQAEQKIKPTIKLDIDSSSEGARCHILLAKIALAKGELRRASIHIEKATVILKNSLIKQNTPEYDKIMMPHPLYLEISILRAKVFNRQQKHSLALKQLQMLQRLVKLQKPYNVSLLANLEEEEAEILVCLGETQNFESCVLRSVNLREQAMGKFNIPNAISFSNLFKYLRYTNDFENSVKYHQKSTEIFSRFPPDHPNAWVMHLSNGLIFFQRRQFQLALPELEAGLRIAERRYSPSHINFMKIRLQFAKLLKGMGYNDRALRILESLEAIISKNIKESALAQRIEHETDDEKITVRKSVLVEMKELYERNRNDKNIARTMLGLERCQVSLRECEEFISNDERIDSLKSLT